MADCLCGCGGSVNPDAKNRPRQYLWGHNVLKYRTNKERLLPKVNTQNPSDCWEWGGARDRRGYGRLNILGKTALAHRISWEAFRGPIPDGLHVCHSCDNPPCINPAHLFLGTDRDNIRDAAAKNRLAPSRARGEMHRKARLTEEDVRAIRGSAESNGQLAERYKVSKGAIKGVRTRKNWRHVV